MGGGGGEYTRKQSTIHTPGVKMGGGGGELEPCRKKEEERGNVGAGT